MRFIRLLTVCWFLLASGWAADPTVSVMSFNIRYGTADDGQNAWEFRRDLVFDVIRQGGYDFVGLQEALRFQLDAIREAVPGYGEVGSGRDDGYQAGEYSAILYRSDRWRVDREGTFWLSDTPAMPGSASWGNRITRIATWARFVNRETQTPLWVFNTHFDHQSQPSREQSAALLAERITRREPRDPVILMGDLNAGEQNPALLYLTGAFPGSPLRFLDTFRAIHPEARNTGTFNGFRGDTSGEKIDFIFAGPGIRALDARILHTQNNGRYPSDHFPVTAIAEVSRSQPAFSEER